MMSGLEAGVAAEPPHLEDGHAKCFSAMQENNEERAAMLRIVQAFKEYHTDAAWEVGRWEYNFSRLPPHHQQLLSTQLAKYKRAREAIHVNHIFIQCMLTAFDPDGDLINAAPLTHAEGPGRASPGDVDKVRYVLKNLARDWSADGVTERAQAYDRIKAALKAAFANWPVDSQQPPRVLLPGAGLGRLCCEVAGMGYEAQGCEFSFYMLIASSFILNCMVEEDQYTIFPWVTGTCNHREDGDQLRGVTLPDVHPASIVTEEGLLSMVAGDFVEVYSGAEHAGAWDAVVTCFFIDTAHNVVQYLEVIHHCLKPGGVWVNLGPLLYHWAEGFGPDELSVEVSLAEIRRVAQAMGFVLRHEEVVDAAYIANPRSMYKTVYQACFWTMTKEGPRPGEGVVPIFIGHHPPPPPPGIAGSQPIAVHAHEDHAHGEHGVREQSQPPPASPVQAQGGLTPAASGLSPTDRHTAQS